MKRTKPNAAIAIVSEQVGTPKSADAVGVEAHVVNSPIMPNRIPINRRATPTQPSALIADAKLLSVFTNFSVDTVATFVWLQFGEPVHGVPAMVSDGGDFE